MAVTPLYGDTGSFTPWTGVGIHFNSFSLIINSGITTFWGYSDDWVRAHGVIGSWTGTAGGFLFQETPPITIGTTGLSFMTGTAGRAGGSITLTFNTGYTFSGIAICTSLALGDTRLGTDSGSYSFQGDSFPTMSWTSS